jgi:DNA modification methylase
MERLVAVSSSPGDVIWEPSGGAGCASLAAFILGRQFFYAEIDENFHKIAQGRINAERERELEGAAQRELFAEAMSDPSE